MSKKNESLIQSPISADVAVQGTDDVEGECERVLQELVDAYYLSSDTNFPRPVIWLSGAPGSGKGANSCHVMRALGISAEPIVVSDLLNSEDLKNRKDHGDLIDSRIVVRAVLAALLRCKGGEGVIMDGYPRSFFQAKFLHLLGKKIQSLTGIDSQFCMIVFSVDEQTSLDRQLLRGRKAIVHNQEVKQSQSGVLREVRPTDTDETLARKRYRNFLDNTDAALRYLQASGMPFVEIDSRGSFEEVKKRIEQKVRKWNPIL
ncbi:MAG: nucleoside monophosphate kinase [Puniceicoccales bacterium]|nr:nucleoside monophosphate kinase [Puniceicoccales bacterium]